MYSSFIIPHSSFWRISLIVALLLIGVFCLWVVPWLKAMSDDPAGQVERDERRALRKRSRKVYHLNDPATARTMLNHQATKPQRDLVS